MSPPLVKIDNSVGLGRETRKEEEEEEEILLIRRKRMKLDYFQKDILVRLESRVPEIGVGERGRHRSCNLPSRGLREVTEFIKYRLGDG